MKVSTPRRRVLVAEDEFLKYRDIQSYATTELAGYQQSIAYLGAQKAIAGFANSLDETVQSQQSLIRSHGVESIETLIKDCIVQPIRMIHAKTCSHFIQRLDTQCKLIEHLQILRQVFFMEAGHNMHQFSLELFKKLDSGRPIDNLYMLNGHFIDCLKPLFTIRDSLGEIALNRMQVTFSKDVSKAQSHEQISTLSALDHMSISFQSDWPLEIILDNDTIFGRYNPILRFLLKIKRVNFILSIRDYWQTKHLERLKPKKKSLNIREQIVEKNRIGVCQLVHQMQLFQQEMLHFSNNLEYYIKTRAIQTICSQLNSKLKEIITTETRHSSGLTGEDEAAKGGTTDMDELVQIHEDFIKEITTQCFLDPKNQKVFDIISGILQITLDFRTLCKHYFLALHSEDPLVNERSSSSDSSMDDDEDQGSIKKGSGMDNNSSCLLNLESLQFVERYTKCSNDLQRLISNHRQRMTILNGYLYKHNKKGVFNNMNEAFIRFNFNEYYIKEEEMGGGDS